MSRVLRAERYLSRRNEPLARFIVEDLGFLDYDETLDWYLKIVPHLDKKGRALLGCNDRYFLMVGLLRRRDLLHPWLFNRCREVEAAPNGHIDLWARYHAKSSFVTIGGIIQETFVDPETTTAIFSATKPLAQEFLGMIKTEWEGNDYLKYVYDDVLYQNPRSKGADGRPSKWSLARGLTVKRKSNPKEATIEAHGLLDGQPTGRHFHRHVYDDIVTQDYLSDELMKKTTKRWEMADNLGTLHGCDKWIVGTRYHWGDTYAEIITRGAAIPRVYPATEDGTMKGKLVLLTDKRWKEIQKTQKSTISAQMLLKPDSDLDATFDSKLFRTYDVIPAIMNVYILVDPSKGRTQRSDRTGIAVVGIDPAGNKYLIDGVCHRMRLSERIRWVKTFRKRWTDWKGVQQVYVGWEQYGLQADLEVLEEDMARTNDHFHVEELNTPQRGPHGKDDRIARLEPDIRRGVFYLPAIVWHPDRGGKNNLALWRPWTEANAREVDEILAKMRAAGQHAPGVKQHALGNIIYYPMGVAGLTRAQKVMVAAEQHHRIVEPIKRKDETNVVYDVTRHAIDELVRHPFAQHDDFIDAMSRIYDMDPVAPALYEDTATMPLPEDAHVGAYAEADGDYDA